MMIKINLISVLCILIGCSFGFLLNDSNAKNVCTKEETYVEQIKIPTVQSVKVRSSEWCLEFPPRCSNYKTEMREVIKYQNETKKRIIRFCCEGFVAITNANETACKPVCKGGCGKGYCRIPNKCKCDAGYTGDHCTQRCPHDKWGEECNNDCKCNNNSICDNRSGICHCTSGWTGDLCQYPCSSGTYGQMCRKICECPECNPIDGKCPTNINRNVSDSVIENLNSTIANITQNLDIIAKNLKNPNKKYLPESSDITTEQSSNVHQEFIVIKPENENPSIILHQPKTDERHFGTQSPEVIHVITNLQQKLKISNDTSVESEKTVEKAHIITTVLIIAIVIFVGVIVTSLFFYRKHLKKNSVSPSASNHVHENKTYVNGKPLPELPGFTTILSRIPEGSDLYDAPRNNTLVKGPYSYARKESLYSVCIPKSRKGSLESHLYDEIRYPSVSQKV